MVCGFVVLIESHRVEGKERKERRKDKTHVLTGKAKEHERKRKEEGEGRKKKEIRRRV